MIGGIVLSKEGISFTAESIAALHRHAKTAEKYSGLLTCGGIPDKQGHPNIHFGVHLTPLNPIAISDQIEDVVFYWYVDQSLFEVIRDNYCVDAGWGRKTRVIPLANVKDK